VMGANAATKMRRVIQNVQRVLAIELLTAAQALDFRHPTETSPQLESVWNGLRKEVSFMDKDRILHERPGDSRKVFEQEPRKISSIRSLRAFNLFYAATIILSFQAYGNEYIMQECCLHC